MIIAAGFAAAVTAQAQTSVLSLADSPGQPYTQYVSSFTATTSQTYLTFFFRQDPAYWGFDNVSFTDGNGNNLAANGSFETGDLTGWMAVGQQGLPAGGQVTSGDLGTSSYNAEDGSYFWRDGAVGGVDGVAQLVSTTVGQNYTLSFWLAGDGGATASFDAYVGAAVSTYDGNTILYNGSQISGGGDVTPAPEPTTLALAGLGIAGLIAARRRK